MNCYKESVCWALPEQSCQFDALYFNLPWVGTPLSTHHSTPRFISASTAPPSLRPARHCALHWCPGLLHQPSSLSQPDPPPLFPLLSQTLSPTTLDADVYVDACPLADARLNSKLRHLPPLHVAYFILDVVSECQKL
jgi:hypothetical protein